jgi:hypothetical protein
MSYYILPKNKNLIIFNPTIQNTTLNPYISHSLHHYSCKIQEQINNINNIDNEYKKQLMKIVNPYEYIFSKVPNTKLSVSKLKPESNIFFDLLEIMNTLSLLNNLNKNYIYTVHYSLNNSSSIDCINMIREFNNDIHVPESIHSIYNCNYKLNYNNSLFNLNINKNYVDFLFYELEDYQYMDMKTYIHIIIDIFEKQNDGGITIIKLGDYYYKPIIDFIFTLCNTYDKVYLMKPYSSNVVSSEKYIICKGFSLNLSYKINLQPLYFLLNYMDEHNNYNTNYLTINNLTIDNLIQNEIQYYFINKLEEFNIIVGQQKIDAMDQFIKIFKNKNKEEKIEMIKKLNIQKCIYWCEKYKIPYNKLNDKANIFLPYSLISEVYIPNDTEILGINRMNMSNSSIMNNEINMEEIKNNFYDCEYTDSELFLLDDLTINEINKVNKVNNNTNVNNMHKDEDENSLYLH